MKNIMKRLEREYAEEQTMNNQIINKYAQIKKGLNKGISQGIKVCTLSAQILTHCDKYIARPQLISEKRKKRLDIPLTLVYTVYVDWVKEKEMHDFVLGVCWGAVGTCTMLAIIGYYL